MKDRQLHLDGAHGEGGGQIVRTALALSTLTGEPFRMTNIRAGRDRPGLKAQHLTAIETLRRVCGAHTNPVSLGSQELDFQPGPVIPGTYSVDIGTAGSIALLLQAVFLPLLFAEAPTTLELRGGTCGRWQTPMEYYQLVFLPYLNRLADIHLTMPRRGYYPKGGGLVRLTIAPRYAQFGKQTDLSPYDLPEGGVPLRVEGISHASESLQPARVAERQAEAARRHLERSLRCPVSIQISYLPAYSTGSGITLTAVFPDDKPMAAHRLGADALGERGKPAERVGKQAANQLLSYLQSNTAVDEYLADQLIPFLALHPGSRMRTHAISDHLLSNCYVVEQFLPVRFRIDREGEGGVVTCLAG